MFYCPLQEQPSYNKKDLTGYIKVRLALLSQMSAMAAHEPRPKALCWDACIPSLTCSKP